MKRYYAANKKKWDDRRRMNRDKINAAKRAAYRNRPEVRQYYLDAAKKYRKKNPHKKRENELKKRYGLTPAKYAEMLESQQRKCAICMEDMKKTPHVDHCHASGLVRGLLCFNCNRAIGHMQDDPAIARSAAEYLEKNK